MALPAPRGLEAIGPYQILADLGTAPWGTVYRAIDTRRDLPVLLKVVPASLRDADATAAADDGADSPETAWSEALDATATLGRLYHRNLPSITGIDEDEDGALLVAFTPVEGRTLGELAAAGELPGRARFAAWCERLAEAQAHGLRHGQISADEVVITPGGEPVLAGFGLTGLSYEPAAEEAGGSRPAPLDWEEADVAALGTLLLRLAQDLPGVPFAAGDPLRQALERAAGAVPPPAADLAEALRQARRPAGSFRVLDPIGDEDSDLPAAAEARARGDRRSALLLLAAALLLALLVLGAGWFLVRRGPEAAALGTAPTGPAPAGILFGDSC